jgi:tetratricopeptide (TPR) repeat protein
VKSEERQKLKHDKYAETVVSGLHWAQVHQSKVIAVIAAAVIIGVAVVWTLHARLQSQQEAQAQFVEYETSADHALGMKGDARTEAIKDVIAHLDGLVKLYPDSEIAPQALLQAADLLSATGQPAKAANYFERLTEMSNAPDGLKMLARRGLAAALEQSGDAEKAIVQYKALAEVSTAQEAVEADWDIGRCYELLKDPENAKTYYKKAIESGGESKWAELARFRVESLERGPAAPESIAPAPATTAAAPAATAETPSAAPVPASTTSTPESTTSTPATTAQMPAPEAPAPATTSSAAAATAPGAQ